MKSKVGAYTMFVLAGAQVVLVVLSWLVTAAMPEDFPRSLLSSEGIRWFFGSFTSNLASPWLVWLLLVSIAWGCLKNSGLLSYDSTVYRQRNGLRLVVAEIVVFVIVILLLTAVPHAILLNVMGGFSQSSFSRSILPFLCFVVITTSLTFGIVTKRICNFQAIGETLSDGIRMAAPLFVIYILLVQLISSLLYLYG